MTKKMRVLSKKDRGIDAGGRQKRRTQARFAAHAWINGALLPESLASIPVFDSAYLYGIGLFETVRVSEGQIRFWSLHDRRLRRNARATGLSVPLSDSEFEKEIGKLLRKNHLKEATVRLMLSETEKGQPSLVITARPYKPYPARCYRKGARLVFSRLMSADSKTLSAIKTTSYLSKMLPRREAAQRGADEALLINEQGHVTEGASSSLFAVKKGVLITPPLNDGLLPGTRRQIIIELANKFRVPLKEKCLIPKDLFMADEIFITSSLKDIMPVGWVEKKKIGKIPGPVTLGLQYAYLELLERLTHTRRRI